MYKCDCCGKEFSLKRDCVKHELNCVDMSYYISRAKTYLLKHFNLIEKQGMCVCINYDTSTGKCLIDVHPR